MEKTYFLMDDSGAHHYFWNHMEDFPGETKTSPEMVSSWFQDEFTWFIPFGAVTSCRIQWGSMSTSSDPGGCIFFGS